MTITFNKLNESQGEKRRALIAFSKELRVANNDQNWGVIDTMRGLGSTESADLQYLEEKQSLGWPNDGSKIFISIAQVSNFIMESTDENLRRYDTQNNFINTIVNDVRASSAALAAAGGEGLHAADGGGAGAGVHGAGGVASPPPRHPDARGGAGGPEDGAANWWSRGGAEAEAAAPAVPPPPAAAEPESTTAARSPAAELPPAAPFQPAAGGGRGPAGAGASGVTASLGFSAAAPAADGAGVGGGDRGGGRGRPANKSWLRQGADELGRRSGNLLAAGGGLLSGAAAVPAAVYHGDAKRVFGAVDNSFEATDNAIKQGNLGTALVAPFVAIEEAYVPGQGAPAEPQPAVAPRAASQPPAEHQADSD